MNRNEMCTISVGIGSKTAFRYEECLLSALATDVKSLSKLPRFKQTNVPLMPSSQLIASTRCTARVVSYGEINAVD